MSKNTQNKQHSGAGSSSEDLDNVDPTVQISNAELAAIRQSASQPEFTPELIAQMGRRRAAEESRQREPTPKYAHPSVGEAEKTDNDPTRSFDRDRIKSMLESHQAPDESKELVSQDNIDTGVADGAIADAVIAQSLSDSSVESDHAPKPDNPPHSTAMQDEPVSHDADNETRDDDDESLAFLDDGMFHDIVFGDTLPDTSDSPDADISEGADASEDADVSEGADISEDADVSEELASPELPIEASQPESLPVEALATEISDPEVKIPKSTAGETPGSLSESDESADLDADPPKKSHPLVILCGFIGLVAICGATVGLLLPDASFTLSPALNALVLAAGTMLLYVGIILRP